MPENKSENKVRVTPLLGTDAVLGWMDPVVDMKVGFGIETRWIVGLDSGNNQVSLAKASGDDEVGKAYPHQLVVDNDTAYLHGFPSGDGCVSFGHNTGLRANGPPTAIGNKMVFLKSNGSTYTFQRG